MAAVEKDESPLSYAYGLLAASYIPETDLSLFFEQIEDIVAQADETPSTLYVSLGSCTVYRQGKWNLLYMPRTCLGLVKYMSVILFYSLQYEGGLEVTGKVISGIFALANRVRSKPALSEVHVVVAYMLK